MERRRQHRQDGAATQNKKKIVLLGRTIPAQRKAKRMGRETFSPDMQIKLVIKGNKH